MIFLVALPLLGYCAAKHYHKNLIIGYGVYVVIKIVYRLALIGINHSVSYALSQGTVIFLELWVMVIIVRFFKGLAQLSKIERKCLRMAEYGYINQFGEGEILDA